MKTEAVPAEVKKTLGEFIEENHRLLSSVGILAALTVFTSNIKPNGLAALVSLFFLTATVLTSVEVVSRFPPNRTMLLTSFRNVFEAGVGGIVVYWLLMGRKMSPTFIQIFLAIIIGYVLSRLALYILPRLIESMRFPDWMARRLGDPRLGNLIAKAIGYPFALVVILISIYLAGVALPRVDSLLGKVQSSLELPTMQTEPASEEPKGPFR